MKYDIDLIKSMRLEGKTLQQISNHYNVNKMNISNFLKRNGIIFWKLPTKCRYCGKTFIPEHPRSKYCCDKHRKLKSKLKNNRNASFYRYANRDNPNVQYNDSLNFLQKLLIHASDTGCELCGSSSFEICRGEVVCTNCGLVFELD